MVTEEGVVEGLVVLAEIFHAGLGRDALDHALTVTLIDAPVVLRVELPLEGLHLIPHTRTETLSLVALIFILADPARGGVVLVLGVIRSLDDLNLFDDLGLFSLQILLLGDLLEDLDVILQILLVTRLVIELLSQSTKSWRESAESFLLLTYGFLVIMEIIIEAILCLLLVRLSRNKDGKCSELLIATNRNERQ